MKFPKITKRRRRTTKKKAGAIARATRTRDARRNFLTRDHVARCIVREIKEGRGSPAWRRLSRYRLDQEKAFQCEEYIKRKLPSMYHQFKQLADIDITSEPMEVGPTTHYVMGGIRVDPDTQMSRVPGLFAAGECAAGINGANRLGGNSLSDLLVFGKRAGEFAAKFARENSLGKIDDRRSMRHSREAVKPFEHGRGENPVLGATRSCKIRCRTKSVLSATKRR